MGSLSLLQGIFPTEGSNPGLLHCSWVLYQLSPNLVHFSRSVVSHSFQSHGLQHARLPGPSTTPGAYSNSCPSHQLCHPTISSSVIPFSSSLQSFPASRSFPMSQFFTSGGQSIGVSASAAVLPMNQSISSGAQSCLTLCDPMDCSRLGFPVHHQLPESTQTHVLRVGDATQPSDTLSSPFPPAFNLSQHQGLFK